MATSTRTRHRLSTIANIRNALRVSSSLVLVLASSSSSGSQRKSDSVLDRTHNHSPKDSTNGATLQNDKRSPRQHVSTKHNTGAESGIGGVKSNTDDAAQGEDGFLTFCVDFEHGLPEKLSSSTRDYRVVAVTGCQCSGKSTLLNALFGTGFPVLERADDTLPKRTTVGAWVDLQLCSPPRKKKRATKSSSKTQTDTAAAPATAGKLPAAQAGKRRGIARKGIAATTTTTTAALSQAHIDRDDDGVAGTLALASGSEGALHTAGGKKSSRMNSSSYKGKIGHGSRSKTGKSPQRATPSTPLVLIDVEGTQSRDRGVDGAEFDSRTMLFAVMASDVIMLNLWAHDVGRADGQAYSVLRSVFEEAVRLCGRPRTGTVKGGETGILKEGNRLEDDKTVEAGAARFPKVLMLVLRDVEEDEQFETLEKAARASMEALWQDVAKPDSLRDAGLSDIFDLKTAGLPHFKYQRREFAAKAGDLSRRFLDPDHSGFMFSRAPRHVDGDTSDAVIDSPNGDTAAAESKGQDRGVAAGPPSATAAVPLSLMQKRLKGIWASAKQNEHLSEIPRRTERAGTVAAAALAESCVSEARPKCARLLEEVEKAAGEAMPLLQFGSDAQGIVDGALRSFHAKVSRAQPQIAAPAAIVKGKREWMISALARELEPAFRAHARHLRAHFHDQFEEAFSCVLGGAPDFDSSAKRMSKTARKSFLEATKMAVPNVPGVDDVLKFHWEAELVRLNSDMENRVQDRLSEGTWMLPPDPAELEAAAAKKKMPWWKGLMLRAAAMYFNYLQATQHMRRAKKASEEREKAVPRLPLF